MKIKDIIIDACELIARYDVAEKLRAGASLEGEEKRLSDELLYCANAVEDELARNYFPLAESEKLTSDGGKISYSSFKRTPVKIKSVTRGERGVKYKLHPQYIEVSEPDATIEYYFAPSPKTLDSDSEFCFLSPRLIAFGTAAEYCLIEGEISRAEDWESRYRAEIDAARAKTRPAFIPPRRWV